jgi:hypothetical protein
MNAERRSAPTTHKRKIINKFGNPIPINCSELTLNTK